MDFENSVDLLNELLATVYRSMPMYLADATPWTRRGDEKAVETITDIITEQKGTCERLAAAIVQRGGVVDAGEYPTVYTDLHFLSLDYLLNELIRAQKADIETIGKCAERLWNDPPAQAMAKEALGAARGHLQSLEELVAETSDA